MNQSITDPERLKAAADWFTILTDIFLRLIKMIIAPLVFATLVAGIAHMGDTAGARPHRRAHARLVHRRLVRVADARACSWSTCCSPAHGLDLPLPAGRRRRGSEQRGLHAARRSSRHLVPTSIVDAMAHNEILQIVVFSVFVGIALAAVGERGRPIVAVIEALAQRDAEGHRLRDAVRAVRGVRRPRARRSPSTGIGVLATYAKFVGASTSALVLLWCLLIVVGVSRHRAARTAPVARCCASP